MNKLPQFWIQILNQIWIQTMEKKCKIEKGKEEVGPAASRSAQASQPHRSRLPAHAQ